MHSAESEHGPLTYFDAGRAEYVTICTYFCHDFAEGDEGAIHCTSCPGYRCSTCGGTGYLRDINGETHGCYACSKLGVEVYHEPSRQWINPYNWVAWAQKQEGGANG